MKNINVNIELLEEIVEEVNYKFQSFCVSNLTDNNKIQLNSKLYKHMDEYELEELFQVVIDYVVNEFQVTFVVEDYYKNAIVFDVIEFN